MSRQMTGEEGSRYPGESNGHKVGNLCCEQRLNTVSAVGFWLIGTSYPFHVAYLRIFDISSWSAIAAVNRPESGRYMNQSDNLQNITGQR